jgi:hypothetical protein
VLADAASTTITQTLTSNYGMEARQSTASIAASGTETQVLKKFEDADLADAFTFQTTLGNAAASAETFVLHNWYATVEVTDQER